MLPLLPAEDIPTTFEKLKEKVTDERLDQFMNYVSDTWLHSNIWPVESLSMFGRSIRTNNDVEGWHNKLNCRAQKGNLAFYMLVNLPFKEARDFTLQCKLVREKKLKRRRRKQITGETGICV